MIEKSFKILWLFFLNLFFTQSQTPYDGAVLSLNPTAYYKFDETSGTTVIDSSGNGNNGLYNGGYTLQSQGIVYQVILNNSITAGQI